MTLRVQDLKPGDVVRIELAVTSVNDERVAFVCAAYGWFSNTDLAAGNAELIVRPRPVRKGDALWCDKHDGAVTFIAIFDGNAVGYWADDNALAWISKDDVRHMDNAPIAWEASE